MCATVKLAEVVSPAQSLNRGKFSHFVAVLKCSAWRAAL
jgi:hypothetical protein